MIIEEKDSNLKFDFKDDRWTDLLKFDEENDYILARNAIQGTKGIDISGIYGKESLVLFELKNFRGYRIENKPRMVGGNDPLWLEVAQKMRDAIAVIVGSARNSTNKKDEWNAYLHTLQNSKKSLHLVLWLEQDEPASPRQKHERITEEEVFRRQLKRSLKWLTQKVDIFSISINPFSENLTVTYLNASPA